MVGGWWLVNVQTVAGGAGRVSVEQGSLRSVDSRGGGPHRFGV